MDLSSSVRTLTQHRLNLSNQQHGNPIDHDAPFAAKKQTGVETKSARVALASPESESLSDNFNDREQVETRHDASEDQDASRSLLEQRYRQLQEDVEVLAAHMEQQERVHEQERKKAQAERLEMLHKNAALECELSGLRVERDALITQSTNQMTQRIEDERVASEAREVQEELLRALTQQQEQTALLQAAVTCGGRDRIEARKALDRAEMHCRRLEEELASAHAQVLHLQNERDTLKAALDATVSGATDFEARQVQAQDEVIASLRADLVQMDFELKTLSVDKTRLEEQVEKLQLRLTKSECGGGYEVIPLGIHSTSDRMNERKGPKKRTTIRPIRSTREVTSRRGSDLFNNLMELPNAVSDPPENTNAAIWSSSSVAYFSSSSRQNNQNLDQKRSFRDRIAPPTGLTSFMAKTVQSARKHLTTPLQNTFGSPQD